MGRISGWWQSWQKGLGRVWQSACRPWLTRRNIPYFVLLALVAFLVAKSYSRRLRKPPPLALAAPAVTGGEEKNPPLRLSQTPEEIGAVWEEMAAENTAAVPGAGSAVDPSAFIRPCSGRVILGRGWRRDKPGTAWFYHPGVDLSVTAGQPVLAMAAGRVTKVAPDDEGGTMVEIEHGQGWRSVYGQLGTVEMQSGQDVDGGQIVGRPLGAQVHLEIWRDRAVLDPLAALPGLG